MNRVPTLAIDFAAITDVGCVRSNNEDSFGFDADHHLYVVCDGMGGRAAGEVASGIAVRTVIDVFASSSSNLAGFGETVNVEERLMAAIVAANLAVYEAGANTPALHSMGTTLVCACLDGDRAVVGNVGDSRAYLIRDRACRQITQDHSFLEEQAQAGNLLPEIAMQSNLQSIITRAIGVDPAVEPDLFAARLQAEDLLLLASDGLTRYVRPEDIVVAAADGLDLPGTCQALIDFAKRCGGVDNITCVLIKAAKVPALEAPADKDSTEDVRIEQESPLAPSPVLPIGETEPMTPVGELSESLGEMRLNEGHI